MGCELLCIVVATVSSLISARFANRVDNRTVGLCTGAVLTVLGAALILLNYWDFIAAHALLHETLRCLGVVCAVLAIFVVLLSPVRFLTRMPSFVFRKLLHMAAFTSVSVMILKASSWQAPALAAIIAAAAIYPLLVLCEKEAWYGRLFVQKRPGEIKSSLLQLFLTVAAIIALGWGALGKRYIPVAAILMWGLGDGAAALVGIPFGKHKITWRLADQKKSYEGTSAMLIVSFIVSFFTLFALSGYSLPICAVLSLLLSALASVAELITRAGMDTATVPGAIVLGFAILQMIFH
ncbi:MAG: hypothetical protein IJ240_11105 [Clostridia bacterium]|nr:hypothetical protein [Clostridia bacterium]